MSYIVIHDDADGVTRYRQFDDQESAVTHLEDEQNRSQRSGGKLYELREVPFEVKFKIELVASNETGRTSESVADVVPVSREERPMVGEAEIPDATATPVPSTALRSVVEPIETFATDAIVETPAGVGPAIDVPNRGEARRGLFGR